MQLQDLNKYAIKIEIFDKNTHERKDSGSAALFPTPPSNPYIYIFTARHCVDSKVYKDTNIQRSTQEYDIKLLFPQQTQPYLVSENAKTLRFPNQKDVLLIAILKTEVNQISIPVCYSLTFTIPNIHEKCSYIGYSAEYNGKSDLRHTHITNILLDHIEMDMDIKEGDYSTSKNEIACGFSGSPVFADSDISLFGIITAQPANIKDRWRVENLKEVNEVLGGAGLGGINVLNKTPTYLRYNDTKTLGDLLLNSKSRNLIHPDLNDIGIERLFTDIEDYLKNKDCICINVNMEAAIKSDKNFTDKFIAYFKLSQDTNIEGVFQHLKNTTENQIIILLSNFHKMLEHPKKGEGYDTEFFDRHLNSLRNNTHISILIETQDIIANYEFLSSSKEITTSLLSGMESYAIGKLDSIEITEECRRILKQKWSEITVNGQDSVSNSIQNSDRQFSCLTKITDKLQSTNCKECNLDKIIKKIEKELNPKPTNICFRIKTRLKSILKI